MAVVGALGTLGTQAALATGTRLVRRLFDPHVLHDVLTHTLDLATGVLLAGLLVLLISLEAPRRGSRQTLAFYSALATTTSFLILQGTPGTPPTAGSPAPVEQGPRPGRGPLAGWTDRPDDGAAAPHCLLARRAPRRASGSDHDPVPTSGPDERPSSSVRMAAPSSARRLPDVDQVDELEELRGTASIVSRFSTMALATVIAPLWTAGGVLAWIEVGSLGALTSTTYGKLVLGKVGIVVVIAAFAGYNRFRLIPEVLDEVNLATDLADEDTEPTELVRTALVDDPDLAEHARDEARAGLRRMSRTVMVEAVLVVVVLALTSVLVNTTPGRSAADTQGVANQTLPIATSTPGSTLNLVVAPAKAGTSEHHPPELRRSPGPTSQPWPDRSRWSSASRPTTSVPSKPRRPPGRTGPLPARHHRPHHPRGVDHHRGHPAERVRAAAHRLLGEGPLDSTTTYPGGHMVARPG